MKKLATCGIAMSFVAWLRTQTPNAVFGTNEEAKSFADSCFPSTNGRKSCSWRRKASR